MTLTPLKPEDLFYLGTLPAAVRTEAEKWHAELAKVAKPIQESLRKIALAMGCSLQTARRKYDKWRESGNSIRALVNKAKVPDQSNGVSEAFIEYITAKAERNQRVTAPAWRKFCEDWRDGKEIPGLDNSLPRHKLPAGTGYDNVNRLVNDAFALKAMRQGLGAAVAKYGPKIFTTRADLWYGSHLMIDDMWHDNFVRFKKQIVRVLELDALDVFSGNLITFGTKPRFRREDGKFDGLKESMARLIVANVYFNEGYSERGSEILAEHGTAAVSEHVARILFDRTGGKIRLRESGITEKEQAIAGWRGQGKGNPRFKAALESMRNLKHNELAMLPGQTGKDRDDRPEYTHGQLKECEDLIKAMTMIARDNPRHAARLQFNLLDYHADFIPLLMGVYQTINHRTWHNLEGWHAAGNILTEYRTTPSSDQWLSDREFSALPEISRQLLLVAAQEDPNYLQARKMSPAEVRARDRDTLTRLPAFVVGELLGEDCARELEVEGAYFKEFAQEELVPETEALIYESVIVTPEGRREQLRDGKYMVFVNPFDLKQLFVHDARIRFFGIARRAETIDRTNPEAVKRAFGNRSKRLAELVAPLAKRHTGYVKEQSARHEHNIGVIEDATGITKAKELRKFDGDASELAEPVVEPTIEDTNDFSAEGLL